MRHLNMGLAVAALGLGFALTGAEASVNRPLPQPRASDAAIVPAAWCVYPGGRTFRVPGPPWECRRFGGFPARGGYGGGPPYRGGPPEYRGRSEYRGDYRRGETYRGDET